MIQKWIAAIAGLCTLITCGLVLYDFKYDDYTSWLALSFVFLIITKLLPESASEQDRSKASTLSE